MSLWAWKLAIATWLGGATTLSAGEQTAPLSGNVRDTSGRAVEHATVVVYRAGLKRGYSTFCPTCHPDCSKRAFTDAAGAFTIAGLSPDLWFDLLVMRDGYVPVLLSRIDPASGPSVAAVLAARVPVSDPRQVVRGRVVDAQGNAVADAVIQSAAILLPGAGPPNVRYSPIDGLEPLAVTNANGEFEIACARPLLKMLLSVEGGGQPRRMISLPAGPERKVVSLAVTATVRGRLTDGGKPVWAEIELAPRGPGFWGGPDLRAVGNTYNAMQIGVREDGTFRIPNVPAPGEWYVFATMRSLAGGGMVAPVPCATRYGGEVVDIGEMQVQRPAYRLRGRIVLSDGKAAPDGAGILILHADLPADGQWVPLGAGGSFEFAGLPAGRLSLIPSVKGYTLPDGFSVGISIAGDVNDFVVTLVPRPRTQPTPASGTSR